MVGALEIQTETQAVGVVQQAAPAREEIGEVEPDVHEPQTDADRPVIGVVAAALTDMVSAPELNELHEVVLDTHGYFRAADNAGCKVIAVVGGEGQFV